MIFLLSAAVPLNFFRVQNFTAATSGSPSRRQYDGAGAALVAAAIDALGHADGADVRALIGELRGVLDEKDRAVGAS